MGKILLVVLAVGLAVFIGCGDTGPAGPQGPAGPPGPGTILVFADIDFLNYDHYEVYDFGPLNRVDSVKVTGTVTGYNDVSCWGTFPEEPGVLIISGSSDDGQVRYEMNYTGEITSWDATLITFHVQCFNSQSHAADMDDYSFVIFGE